MFQLMFFLLTLSSFECSLSLSLSLSLANLWSRFAPSDNFQTTSISIPLLLLPLFKGDDTYDYDYFFCVYVLFASSRKLEGAE